MDVIPAQGPRWPRRFETTLRLAWVWLTVPRLPPLVAPAGTIAGRDPALAVLGIGDSIIAGIGVARPRDCLVAQVAAELGRDGRGVCWRGEGVAGATGRHLVELLGRAAGPAPDLVLVSCGVNDVIRGRAPASIASDFREFVVRVRERWPRAVVVHAGIPPLERFPALAGRLGAELGRRARDAAAAVDAAARDCTATYTPFPADVSRAQFARDGFHPDARGCARWAEAVVGALPRCG